MSSIAKFDVENFDGSNDFGLWPVKMRCLLIQHGWEAALDPFSGTMTDADKITALKTDVYKKAHNALLLCLDNKVLREVIKEDSVAGVWLKLETLYMTNSLANKLYLKKKLFTFYMDLGKKLSEHIDEFNKLIGDLANIDVDIDDEDHALMLLTSLPSSYDNFVEILLYGRESLTLEDDHLKKDYQKRNKKKSTGFVKKNVGQGSGMHYEGYDNGDLFVAVSKERFLEWIMESGGSFHVTRRRDFLFDFKEFNGGTVLLDDNRACAIKEIGKVRVQMKDGTMKGNCMYSLDGWAESSEAIVGIQEKESLAQVWHKRLGHLVKQACMNWKEEMCWGIKGVGAADSGKKVEFEVELQGSRVEPTVDPHTGENPGNEDEEQDEEPQQQNLDNYILEAINSSEKDKWVRAMEEEMSSLKEESYLGTGRSTTWSEARIDYNEVFSPVVRHTSIRVILSLTACEDYELKQLDVKTAFLHGNLEETIYTRQPSGFEEGTGNKDFAPGMYIYLLLYVDDMLIAYKNKYAIEYTKGQLRKEFDMKELGPVRKILGMEIIRDRGSRTLKVSQSGYVQKSLNNYRMDNVKSVSVLLGAHFKDTANVGLVYGRDQGKHVDVDGFVNADYAKDTDKDRSITGEAVKENIWLKGLLIKLGVNLRPVVVNCDNQSAIHLSRNAMFHERTKHINVRYHFIREIVESKEIEVEKISTEDNAADAFTNVVQV
nr:hypothetical protein [Tanacetum cinerariifolium]